MTNEPKEVTKEDRIELLSKCVDLLIRIKDCYQYGFPGHLLTQAALAHIRSAHHLEAETNFDNITLGVGEYMDAIDKEDT
jgi:hypothetical protein